MQVKNGQDATAQAQAAAQAIGTATATALAATSASTNVQGRLLSPVLYCQYALSATHGIFQVGPENTCTGPDKEDWGHSLHSGGGRHL